MVREKLKNIMQAKFDVELWPLLRNTHRDKIPLDRIITRLTMIVSE